jgi:hypothetical protein
MWSQYGYMNEQLSNTNGPFDDENRNILQRLSEFAKEYKPVDELMVIK